MNKKQLKLACAAVSVSIAVLGLLGAAWQPETTEVKMLLEKRTHIMENVLTGKITYEEGKQQLKEIESETLYRQDLENLRQYADTDVDRVENMQVVSIVKKDSIYGILAFQAEICWICRGYDGAYTQMGNYVVGVKKSMENYKLISLEQQQGEH